MLPNSPLNTNLWLHELAGDEEEAFLADGIINSFQLVDPNTQFIEVNMRNYKSATNPTFKLLVEKQFATKFSKATTLLRLQNLRW